MTRRAIVAALVSGTLCWLLIVVTVLAVTLNRATSPPDALAAYEHIRPGAPRSVMQGYLCYDLYFADENFCEVQRPGETVRAVYVSLAGDVIRRVSLSVQGIPLRELEARYGQAVRRVGSARLVFRYCFGSHVAATVYARPFGVLPPTTFVTLASPDAARLC